MGYLMMATEERRPKKGKPIGVRLPAQVRKELESYAGDKGDSMSGVAVDAITKYLRGEFSPVVPDPATQQFRIKLLGRVPCGPLRDALEETSDLPISRGVASRYRIEPTDFAAIAEGESMMGADMEREGDIRDGDVVVFQLLQELERPRNGQIVAVQVETEDGIIEGTIKKWNNGTPPFLTDGKGERVEIRDGAQLRPLGVARMLMRGL